MNRTTKLALLSIITLAGFLRFFHLNRIPPALYWDEASIAYNAFSILQTGRDEHGISWPITHFLAYGDAKPPLYIYTTSVSMAIFGVNDFAVRAPSALAGTLAVLITFFLVHRLASSSSRLIISPTRLALLSSFLLAISPWHLQMSRAAFEANLALTLHLLAFTLFLYWLKQNPKKFFSPSSGILILSSLFFVTTLYTFNSYRIFLPFWLLFLALHYRRHLTKHPQSVITASLFAGLCILPLIPFVLSPQAKLRFNEVTIFNNHDPVIEANTRIELNHHAFWSRLLHNRRVLFALDFLAHYTDHFKPDFLFFSGDVNPRLSVRDIGEMYLIEFPFLILGLYYLFRHRYSFRYLFVGWILLAIIPAAVARETPHALRILQVLPVPQILVALGLLHTIRLFPKTKYLLAIAYLFFFSSYLELYYAHYAKRWSHSWQYGYQQLVSYLQTVASVYDRIYVTDSLGRPHTYILYYSQYDPESYWQTRDAGGDAFGFTYTNSFGKYYFTPPTTPPPGENWLQVTTELSPQQAPLHTIYDLNHQPIFVISTIN